MGFGWGEWEPPDNDPEAWCVTQGEDYFLREASADVVVCAVISIMAGHMPYSIRLFTRRKARAKAAALNAREGHSKWVARPFQEAQDLARAQADERAERREREINTWGYAPSDRAILDP